jgi:nucleobase:cation symporter-1, NCS1 family
MVSTVPQRRAYMLSLRLRSVSNAGGAGAMFDEPGTAPNQGWAFMFGIMAILGSWGAGTLGQSDWTRYADRRFAPTCSQLLAAPFTIAVTATIGIIVTSASRELMGGEIIWNPIMLLAGIQEKYDSDSKVRAGVFFASIGLVTSQLAISIVLNSVSTGMDMAGLCPKYINIVRGSYIMAAIGIATQPWQLLSTATRFLEVLSGFGVFMAPATGIMLADYHIVRRYKLKLNDLYTSDPQGIYWYFHGVNWRAPVSFLMGVWPLLRKSSRHPLLSSHVRTPDADTCSSRPCQDSHLKQWRRHSP